MPDIQQFTYPDFADDKHVDIVIVPQSSTPPVPRVSINGRKFELPYNTAVNVPECVVDALAGGGFTVTDAAVAGGVDDAAAGGDDGAPASLPAGDFDVEAFIGRKVPDVVAELDGLTAEQLNAVLAAEQDREVPRTGVTKAITDKLALGGDV